MLDSGFLMAWEDATLTALGFFWKAAWAFVMGYAISAMIQAFVPRDRLTAMMGDFNFRSISLATVAGALSSSCSFAALAAARTLFAKGAHFVAAVAFMFASTNLVIELGVLILIFLGWQFLAAELIGGVVLIGVSALLIRFTLPEGLADAARDRAKEETQTGSDSFDWRQKIASKEGWAEVGENFFGEWAMVWKEILFGFTVAGFIAVLVPTVFWETIFLSTGSQDGGQGFFMVVQNALIAPLVAAATFIGSMGNIPLATVLNANGVLFAGIMGFIYSDLMVPPLVKVNAKYYGAYTALYIAGIMYVSIVLTAVLLHYGFALFGAIPEQGAATETGSRFKLDYTFFLNLVSVAVIGVIWWLRVLARRNEDQGDGHQHHDHGGSGSLNLQTVATSIAALALLGGGVLLIGSALA